MAVHGRKNHHDQGFTAIVAARPGQKRYATYHVDTTTLIPAIGWITGLRSCTSTLVKDCQQCKRSTGYVNCCQFQLLPSTHKLSVLRILFAHVSYGYAACVEALWGSYCRLPVSKVMTMAFCCRVEGTQQVRSDLIHNSG